MALVSSLAITLNMTETGTADFGAPTSVVSYAKTLGLSSGTGAGAADMRWSDQRTLTTGATEDLDLAGVLTGAFGNTLTFVKLKGIIVYAATTNTTNLTVSRPGAAGVPLFAAVSDALAVLPAGGLFVYWNPSAAGVAVTATTADLITITNSAGASAVYDVHLIGASA